MLGGGGGGGGGAAGALATATAPPVTAAPPVSPSAADPQVVSAAESRSCIAASPDLASFRTASSSLRSADTSDRIAAIWSAFHRACCAASDSESRPAEDWLRVIVVKPMLHSASTHRPTSCSREGMVQVSLGVSEE